MQFLRFNQVKQLCWANYLLQQLFLGLESTKVVETLIEKSRNPGIRQVGVSGGAVSRRISLGIRHILWHVFFWGVTEVVSRAGGRGSPQLGIQRERPSTPLSQLDTARGETTVPPPEGAKPHTIRPQK